MSLRNGMIYCSSTHSLMLSVFFLSPSTPFIYFSNTQLTCSSAADSGPDCYNISIRVNVHVKDVVDGTGTAKLFLVGMLAWAF